jgi:hypothetical protein
MKTKFDFAPQHDRNIVYVRAVDVADLPDDLRAEAGDIDQLFAVHSAAGERLALVRDRKLAFFLARENDFAPVNVH